MTTTRDMAQFMRIESYARVPSKRAKRTGYRSAADIVDEVLREPHAIAHIPNPLPPENILGSPTVALNIAQDMANETYDSIGRRSRKDAHILAGCVCSYPIPVAEIQGRPHEEKLLEKWIDKSVEWTHKEFRREHVGAIVLHMDEAMPHLHVLLTPPAPGVEPSPLRRAGKAAVRAAGQSKKRNSIERSAFIKEARRLQDSYCNSVSQHFGHTRHGMHRRKRMTRAERNIENSQARALMEVQRRAAEVQRELDERVRAVQQREREVERSERQLTSSQADLDKQKQAVQKQAAFNFRGVKHHMDQHLNLILGRLSSTALDELRRAVHAVDQQFKAEAGLSEKGFDDSLDFDR